MPSQRRPGTRRTAPVYGPGPGPEELAARAAEYPGHAISRETTRDRTRYVARSIHPGSRPHTVVTDSAEELFDALADARQPQEAVAPASDPASGALPPGARNASPAH